VSALDQAMADYLQLRNSLGHDLAEARWLLPSFVAYLDDQGLGTVTVQAALTWAQTSPTGKGRSVAPRRMSAARGFARYLAGIDENTEVPPLGLIPTWQRWRWPFIYRLDEQGAREGKQGTTLTPARPAHTPAPALRISHSRTRQQPKPETVD
jgi:hypothetical protein